MIHIDDFLRVFSLFSAGAAQSAGPDPAPEHCGVSARLPASLTGCFNHFSAAALQALSPVPPFPLSRGSRRSPVQHFLQMKGGFLCLGAGKHITMATLLPGRI